MSMPNQQKNTESARSRKLVLGICFFLVVLVWVVFGQTLTHDFVNYDDQGYVFENAQVLSGLTLHGIVWAFTHTHSFNWHPLTWISHMLDCQFFGLHAGETSFHQRAFAFTRGGPALSGFTPNDRRPVAQRVCRRRLCDSPSARRVRRLDRRTQKTSLGGVFFLLTLGAYTHYVRHPSTLRYLRVCLFFALGLMCKPMLVTLPLVLLIVDYWPLERLSPTDPNKSKFKKAKRLVPLTAWIPLIREKIPLFVLSIGSCLITLVAQRAAIAPVDQLPLLRRLCNAAALAVVIYLRQMIFPGPTRSPLLSLSDKPQAGPGSLRCFDHCAR